MSKKPSHAVKPWTQAEVLYLHRHFVDQTNKQLARNLNRGVYGVERKLAVLGLRRKRFRAGGKIVVYFSKKDREIIERSKGTMSLSYFVRKTVMEALNAKTSR